MRPTRPIRNTLLSTRKEQPKPRRFTRCAILHNTPSFTPFTRRLFKLPSPPPTPPQNHHDLPSFLTYADRIALPESSTTYVGMRYEYTVQQALRRFAFSLHRVGGRDDLGVDLVGTWHLPKHEHPLRVFVQCKALKTKLGPNFVRELEGSFNLRSSPVDGGGGAGGKLGVLVGTREATKGVRDAMARSPYPVMWMMVEKERGTLLQALWNAKGEEMGLGGLGVEVQFSSEPSSTTKSIALTCDGEEIPGMDEVERNMAELEDRWMALWGKDGSMPESRKLALLDIVEKLYPEEKPLFGTTGVTGTCSMLSDEDRERVLQLVRENESVQKE
ncbi:uncharacterized protein ACHE_40759S [Aspergillus chevalieri]|uniref:Restriction endonuclease type IV Mrr domain-containing protein n=1 Tax=Aspergillus chevalieri TaxID=182096 RepID=A0A7R7VP46_ASPCH|nr:uncharacterized protein ACHE_40759S [Aspergillus chevalieri]BCR88195.1 hypothetical protein ACHE_40759S [Aspergillus chevalieri]